MIRCIISLAAVLVAATLASPVRANLDPGDANPATVQGNKPITKQVIQFDHVKVFALKFLMRPVVVLPLKPAPVPIQAGFQLKRAKPRPAAAIPY